MLEFADRLKLKRDVVKLMKKLQNGQKLQENLEGAAVGNDTIMGDHILNRGGHINSRYREYVALVQIAASAGSNAFFEMLVRRREPPKLDVTDNIGITLLHSAVVSGNLDMIAGVKEAYEIFGVEWNVNVTDEIGNTPVHAAAKLSRYGAVDALGRLYGADMDVENKLGMTPMHVAIAGSNQKMAELLVGLGAKITDSIIDFAEKAEMPDVAQALREYRSQYQVPEQIGEKKKPSAASQKVDSVDGNVVSVDFGAKKKTN